MICPLCRTRKARRGCPALGRQICAVCCGTKRLVEIACPSDCTWLASAREHPPAAVLRQQQRDVGFLVRFVGDMSQRQSQLFLLVSSFLIGYHPPELQPLADEDVADAFGAMASTFETASRGVIYDHRPASQPAERLAVALKPLLAEAGQGIGSAFERDAAVVLRRLAGAAREVRTAGPDSTSGRRPLLDLLARVIRAPQDTTGVPADSGPEDHAPASRLILP